jgi:ABC-type cobalamin/Fe3+-siderophores transport system ATPase subunit
MHQPAKVLDSYHRTCVWLAVHILRDTKTLILDGQADDVAGHRLRHLHRLLRQAAQGRTVVISMRDGEAAGQIGDRVLRLSDDVLVLAKSQEQSRPAQP